MTRVVVFSAMAFEENYLREAGATIEWTFVAARLTTQTAVLAVNATVVVAFVNDQINAACLQKLSDLGIRGIALRCAGFNQVDLNAAKQYGIRIARVPAYSPHAVAEHAVALLLTLNRKTHRAWNRVRESNFALDGLIGFDLHGKTVGVIGGGKIGSIFAGIMLGFGCRVVVCDPVQNPELHSRGVHYTDISTLLRESDIVSLHCPLTKDTYHLLNAERLNLIKPSAFLINTGRGALIDTAAVIQRIKQHQLAGLALDVYEEEAGVFFADHSREGLSDDQLARLTTFPNVLITGHQGFCTQEALQQIAQTTVENIAALASGAHCVNEL